MYFLFIVSCISFSLYASSDSTGIKVYKAFYSSLINLDKLAVQDDTPNITGLNYKLVVAGFSIIASSNNRELLEQIKDILQTRYLTLPLSNTFIENFINDF